MAYNLSEQHDKPFLGTYSMDDLEEIQSIRKAVKKTNKDMAEFNLPYRFLVDIHYVDRNGKRAKKAQADLAKVFVRRRK